MSAYDAKLIDEAARLGALQRYGVLDTDPERGFDLITELVQDLLGVPICAVSLVDEDRQWFKSRQGLGAAETSRQVAFCDHTIRGRETMIVGDAREDPRFAGSPLVTGDPGIRAYAGAPLVTPDGYVVGALCAIDTTPRRFSRNDETLLRRFAELAVEQLELRTLAFTDPLTGALSRRGFVEAARRAHEAYGRAAQDAALISFDLDTFKVANDRFGHGCGNDVLHDIANACLRLLRPLDRLGRLGGDEFGVLLSGVSLRQAKACSERLRKAFAAMPHPLCGPITASFGIAMLERELAFDQWQLRADRALYSAKNAGRNCTIVFDKVRHGPTLDRRHKDEQVDTWTRLRAE